MTDTTTPDRKIFTIELGGVTSEQALEILDRVESEILQRDDSNYESTLSETKESFILSGAAEQLADKITETRSPEQIEQQAVIEAEAMITLSKQPE